MNKLLSCSDLKQIEANYFLWTDFEHLSLVINLMLNK